MFDVISVNGKVSRTVYAVDNSGVRTLFLIFETGKWMWIDANLYKPKGINK